MLTKNPKQFEKERFASPLECTIAGCDATTFNPESANPRERWLVNTPLAEDPEDKNSEVHLVTLCPKHVRELLPVDEDFFDRMDRTEKMIERN